jgi:hypothetical protein
MEVFMLMAPEEEKALNPKIEADYPLELPSLEEMKARSVFFRDLHKRVKFTLDISDEEIQTIVRNVLNGTHQWENS